MAGKRGSKTSLRRSTALTRSLRWSCGRCGSSLLLSPRKMTVPTGKGIGAATTRAVKGGTGVVGDAAGTKVVIAARTKAAIAVGTAKQRVRTEAATGTGTETGTIS